MALIKCTKCGNEISDKANNCPDCGANMRDIMADYIRDEIEKEYKEKEKKLTFEISEKYRQEYEKKIHAERERYQKEYDQKLKEQSSVSVDHNQKNSGNKNWLKVASVFEAVCIVILICILVRTNMNTEKNMESSIVNSTEVEESELFTNQEKEATDLYIGEEFKMGNVQYIHTEFGDFEITFDHVRLSDWKKRSGREEDLNGLEVVLLECTVNNINYNDPYNSDFYLEHNMVAVDDQSYVIDELGWSYDDGEYLSSPEIPEGMKAKICVPFKVKEEAKKITFTFDDGNYITTEIEK